MLPTPQSVLEGVHACLSGDPHIQSALGNPPRLFDTPPEDVVHPYAAYGAIRLRDVSGDSAPLVEVTLNLHVYSRYEGRAEAMSIISLCLAALERDRLRPHLPGTAAVVSRYADSFVSRDGHSRHSVLRLAITVEGAEATLLQGEAA